jgi:hypothetical protein
MTAQTMAAAGSPTTSSGNPLIAGARVAGTDVYNASGDHLGEIYDIMLDKQTGKVAYAIMSFGGFLGLGEKYHPIPWSVLDYDTNRGGYVVPLTKERLEAAPMYDSEGEPDWDDRAYGKRVHDYYGTMPYWMM